jgi:hypothetical protein
MVPTHPSTCTTGKKKQHLKTKSNKSNEELRGKEIASGCSKNTNPKWSPARTTDPSAPSKAVATLHLSYLLPSHHRLYLLSQQKSKVASNGKPKSGD